MIIKKIHKNYNIPAYTYKAFKNDFFSFFLGTIYECKAIYMSAYLNPPSTQPVSSQSDSPTVHTSSKPSLHQYTHSLA